MEESINPWGWILLLAVVSPSSYDTKAIIEIEGDEPLRLHSLVSTANGDIAAFFVSLEYKIDDEWRKVAAIPHETRVVYNGTNVKKEGFVAQRYEDGDITRKQRYGEPDELSGKSEAECLELAHKIIERQCEDWTKDFKQWHGINHNE